MSALAAGRMTSIVKKHQEHLWTLCAVSLVRISLTKNNKDRLVILSCFQTYIPRLSLQTKRTSVCPRSPTLFSAMASVISLCLLWMCLSLLIAEQVLGAQPEHRHSIKVRSLLPSRTDDCLLPASTPSAGLVTLSVACRRGPCSPVGSSSHDVSHGRLLRRDRSRVSSIHRHLLVSVQQQANTGGNSIPARSGLSLGTGDYVVALGVGTPARDFSVIFDTGSDLTWIQCQPCVGFCYPQEELLFDPSSSSSYTNVSCSAAECTLAGGLTTCQDAGCIYALRYGDGSYTTGFLAQETVTLSPTSDVLTSFMFGCGEFNHGLFGSVAGLLGLGRGSASLVSQTQSKYGGVFSYCLPPFASSTGYLSLGAGAMPLPSNMQFTPLASNPPVASFYFVGLTGISVDGKELPILPDIFAVGTIVDSGTVVTRLPPDAYIALRDEFRRHMASRYPVAPALSILDTCYNLTGHDNVSVPEVALEFDGSARLDVDASGILYVASISQACLAFAANDDPAQIGVIGNMQQRGYSMVYDVAGGRIGFGAKGCS